MECGANVPSEIENPNTESGSLLRTRSDEEFLAVAV
jgi:hypothetical protein